MGVGLFIPSQLMKLTRTLLFFAALFFSAGIHAQNALVFSIDTDCWGGEVSWQLTDQDGNVVAEQATGTYGNQSNFTENLEIADGCYTFTISDTYGDGMNGSSYSGCTIDGYYSITDDQGNIVIELVAANAAYGDEETQSFALGTALNGCTDPAALNYSSCATTDDGSCTYPVLASVFSFDAGASCGATDVQFTNASTGNITGYSWDFPGGTPSTSTDENPSVNYATAGTYTATLTVTDADGDAASSQDVIIDAGIQLEIVIVQDNYPQETSWDVVDEFGNTVANGDANGGTVCLADNCHTFTIYDSYGDGICCGYGQGSYSLLLNGVEIASGGEFANSQAVSVNCPPGSDCNNTISIGEGEHSSTSANAWYTFTPEANGQYRITTCDRATCDTRIWMYDYCLMENFDDTNESTLTYNDDFCGVQSEITPLLEGGLTYYLRIGGADNVCAENGFDFFIEYMGPIQGCTDPAACNYLPIAEIDDVCYFPGDIQCPSIGPDLEVLGDVFHDSMYSTTLTNNDACYVNEGCMQGFGERQILRFTTHIKNIGTEDYFIGDPNDQPDQFEYDDCHNHWHYEGYAEYVLYDGDGNEMPQIGFKNGFCVLDLECSDGGQAKYTCGNMGVTAGCGDIYSSGLSCQWVDITEVPAGNYTLLIRTNWDQSPDANGSYELSYENNWAAVCVSFDRDVDGNIIDFTKSLDCPLIFDCAGVPFGASQPDCANNCPGIVVQGDVNNTAELEVSDAQQYIQDILGNDAVVTSCTDMDSDGVITITDAALIAGCTFYGPDHVDELGVHDHCVWDTEFIDPNHNVTLSIGEINTDLGYVDVYVTNPDNEIVAYEFELSGLTIQSVENLVDPLVYDVNPQSSLGGNKVMALSYSEQIMPKYLTPTPMVRVYYASLTDQTVCVSSIIDIVNENYHNTLTTIGACQTIAGFEFVDFSADNTNVCQGEAVNFTDLSEEGTVNWMWSFPGGNPASSTDQNPTGVVYDTPGTYTVILTAENGIETDTESKIDYITVEAGSIYYADTDNDGFGDDANTIVACAAPQGYVISGGDCDDSRDDVYPDAPELCDGIDNNCNGEFDENAIDMTTWFLDGDNDGFGDVEINMLACEQPAGYVDNAEDCDDSRDDVYPGAAGTAENIDNNCDGQVTGDEVIILPCEGDFNNDGNRDIGDLLMMLQFYGCNIDCDTDVDMNGDGIISQADMLEFLAFFGTACD